jgi:hypothetical protein
VTLATLIAPLGLPIRAVTRRQTILAPFRRYLAAALLAVAAFVAAPAAAQTYTATITVAPNLGNVIPAASGTTTFRVAASNGAVSTVSGTGTRKTVGSVTAQVTIACSSPGSQCNGSSAKVFIGSGADGTKKGLRLTTFTAANLAGGTALTSIAGGTTNQSNFTYTHTNKAVNATFNIGFDFPIRDYTTGATGADTVPIYVWVARSSQTPTAAGPSPHVPANGSASVSTYAGLTLGVTGQMNFGTVAKPSRDPITNLVRSSVITMDPTSGAVSATGVALTRGTPVQPVYAITGESGATISVTPATTMDMTNQTDNTKKLTVTLTTSTLPTALGTVAPNVGKAGFTMGGSFTVDSDTTLGVYTGTYNTTVAYN